MSKSITAFSRDAALPADAQKDTRSNEEPKKQSREEWRKKKELEEARKLGTAPAEVDEEGKLVKIVTC